MWFVSVSAAGPPPPAHTCRVHTRLCPVCGARCPGEPADTMKMSPLDVGPLGRPLNLDTSTSADASNLLIVAKLRRSSETLLLCFGGRGRPALPGDGATW